LIIGNKIIIRIYRIGKVYLPHPRTIDIFFLRQIMTGEKKACIFYQAEEFYELRLNFLYFKIVYNANTRK